MNLKIRLLNSETIGITVAEEMKMRDFRKTVADHSLKEPDQIRLSLNKKDLIDNPEKFDKSIKECDLVSGDIVYVHDAATLQAAPTAPAQTEIFVNTTASPSDSQKAVSASSTSSSDPGVSPYKQTRQQNQQLFMQNSQKAVSAPSTSSKDKQPHQHNQNPSKHNGDKTCHILRLPSEVVHKILFKLNVTSLRNVCLTCKDLYKFWLTDEHLWDRLLRRDFNFTNPKQIYKDKFIERRQRQVMIHSQPAVVPQPQPDPFNFHDNPPNQNPNPLLIPQRNPWPGIMGGNQDLNPFHNPRGPEIGPRIFPRQPGPGQPQRPRFPGQNPPDFGGFYPGWYQ